MMQEMNSLSSQWVFLSKSERVLRLNGLLYHRYKASILEIETLLSQGLERRTLSMDDCRILHLAYRLSKRLDIPTVRKGHVTLTSIVDEIKPD